MTAIKCDSIVIKVYFSNLNTFQSELSQLKKDVKESTRAAYGLETKKNLLVQWRAFSLFCTYFKLSCFPVSLSTICCYAQFLSRSLKYVDSIRNDIIGVRVLHIYLDYPFRHLENFVYKLLIKGLVKTKQHFPRRALPITPDILLEMVTFLDLSDPSDCVFGVFFYLPSF